MITLGVVEAATLHFRDTSLHVESAIDKLCREYPLDPDGEHATLVALAREIGLKRPGSAPFTTLSATVLLHTMQAAIANAPVMLCTCSSTGPAEIATKFETAGVTNGWATADPFWLQNTLPSFAASAIFNALRLRGQALGFPGDLAGIYSGLYQSAIAFAGGRVERAVVVVAEDGLQFLQRTEVEATSSWKGCAALVLQRVDGQATSIPTLSIAAETSGGRASSDPALGYRLLDDVVRALQSGQAAESIYIDAFGQTYRSKLARR